MTHTDNAASPAGLRRISSDDIAARRGSVRVELPCDADIPATAEDIFATVIDFAGQDGWLSESSAYKGTVDVSTDPVTLGTTYREPGPLGTRFGIVTRFAPPTAVTFDQPMVFKLGAGTLGVTVSLSFRPNGDATRVHRVCALTIPRRLRPVRRILERAFRTESARTLAALKARFDQLAAQGR